MNRILFSSTQWMVAINSTGLNITDTGNAKAKIIPKTDLYYSDWLKAFDKAEGNSKELKELAFSALYPGYVKIGD